MPNVYDTQLNVIGRRQKILDALQQYAMTPQQGQMVSGHYVAPGLLQALAQPLTAALAGIGQQRTDQQLQDVTQKRAQAMADVLGSLQNQQSSGASPTQIAAQAAGSDFPEIQEMGLNSMQQLLKPQKPETFELQTIRGPDGNLTLAQVGSYGTIRQPSGGFKPYVEPKVFRGEVYDPSTIQPGQQVGAEYKTPTTNINMPLETSRQKALGEVEAKEIGAARQSQESAQNTFLMADRLQQLDSDGTFTGPLARPAVLFNQFSQALGMPISQDLADKVSRTENFDNTIGKEISNMVLNSSAGRGFTDTDRVYVERSFPSLMMTPQGRKQAIQFLKEASVRGLQAARAKEQALLNGNYDQLDITGGKMPAYMQQMQGQQQAPATPQAPRPGTVMDGYIFQGGDPAEPGNWRKQ